MMAEFNKNTLREPATKVDIITDEQWNQVNSETRELVDEYFEVNKQLSEKTRMQYISAMRQFFLFVYEKLNNKVFYKITKRDFMKYMSAMQDRGLSSSAIGIRKSAVSSFCNYIEVTVAEDVEEYKGFRNFTRGMPAIPKTQVYDKIAVSNEEYELLMKELEKREHYLAMAWVATAFNVGGRRAEIIQFKTEILDYPIPEGQNYVLSHIVRGKGRGDGKALRYMINLEALKYLKLWVDKRGFESEYIFATKGGKKVSHISIGWANDLCANVLSPILNRRINPHLFKASCISRLLEDGVDMKIVSKYIAHHNDISTTSTHYDLRNFEEEKNNIFKK
jgi:site-specific recombinase XerC